MTLISEIRCAVLAEQAPLTELHRRSSYVWEVDRAQLQAHPDALGVASEAIVDGRVRVAVGPEGQLLGFCIYADAGGGVCELDDLFVEPDVMRRGIGQALVQDATQRAMLGGYRQLTVVAHPRNFAFYESVGFVVGEAVRTRFGPATRLRRALG
jgi:GNAT superfamily N-acetyltransferase